MTNNLNELLQKKLHQDYATSTGVVMHSRMQNIFFDSMGKASDGNADIIKKISKNPELVEYMGPNSKTEVPIAGYINGRFVSRRIDRLYVNLSKKIVVVLDYKTDIDKVCFRDKYTEQLREYRSLLMDIYPYFNITCKILWLNDFTLETVI
ncbi:MAG: hypothetical protein J5742_01640 [Alphaproteobacteria bacterium]|nr:hypothetical protein [Alphaproteobacteria bacterium]